MTVIRENVSSGSQSEDMVSHSRAVKVGNTVYFSGTTGMNYKTNEISTDPVEQFRQMMANVENALTAIGGSIKDIVQTTVLVTSPEITKMLIPHFRELFRDVRPTTEWPVVALSAPYPCVIEMSLIAVLGCPEYPPIAIHCKQ